jgi:uncharacterized protein YqiB (DUF1249 family)
MFNQVRPINKSFCLQMLCEENYAKLQRLSPPLHDAKLGTPLIAIDILEKAPYTHIIELKQRGTSEPSSSGCFTCRVYLDTKSVEVISIDGYTPSSAKEARSPRDVLNQKWALNYLLEKWLNYQLQSLNPPIKRYQAISA